MVKSKSKSKSRSISRWLFSPFKSSSPSAETTAAEDEAHKSKQLSAETTKSKSQIKRRRTPAEEAKQSEEPALPGPPAPAPAPPVPPAISPAKPAEETPKKEKTEEKKEGEKKEKEKDSAGSTGSKSEEVKKSAKKEKEEQQEASVFEEVVGPAAPAQSGTHGIKNKMRWKIDVDPVDVNGDQKMGDVVEKVKKLRKKFKTKQCKVLKANEPETAAAQGNEEPPEDLIILSARVLQLIKLESLITKELTEPEQETLRAFCRSGDHEDQAEALVERLVDKILNAVVQKNEFCRQVSVAGQLRIFAVDEKKAKVPMMGLMMARKDLLYVAWSKPNRDFENKLDPTWANMTIKKVPQATVVSTML